MASPQSWVLTTKDGTGYTFNYGQPQGSLLQSITDRNDNQITITRTSTKITLSSSNGRYINLTLATINGADVITQAQDSAGRTTSYGYTTYGSGGKQTSMTSSTDLNGKTTNYTWYTPQDVGSIKPSQRDGQYVEEADIGYTPSGCGSGCQFGFLTPPQTQGYYQIVYNADGTKDIYDPQVIKRHLVFNSGGYLTSETLNYGSTPSEPTTYIRDPTSNFVTKKTDALGRETKYGYDFTTTKVGDLLSVTGNATGTPFTTTFAYTPAFHVLDSITDPLGHTTTFTPFSPDTNGNIQTFKDAVGNTITFSYNPAGQVLTATDQASDKTTFGYAGTGDLTSVIDPNNFKTASGYDLAGRLTSVTDPLRNTTSYQLDGVGRVTQVTDPGSGITKFVYDDVGNLLSVTDANNHVTTTNKYDLRNRLTSACDAPPLNRCASFSGYDADNNLTQVSNAAGVITQYQYDNLNRRIENDYGVGGSSPSNVQLTYDLGDRLTKAVDSANGTITRQFGTSNTSEASGLDFITEEATPTGTVDYVPNLAGLRTSMTVTIAGVKQPPVDYNYDAADKLLSVSQNGSTTTKNYLGDPAGRLHTVTLPTLPNALVVTYGYDQDSQVTSLTYGSLGSLRYNLDADGRRTGVSGTLAATVIPSPLSSLTYNNDNSLASIGGASVTNNPGGNITAMNGTCPTCYATFSYDARGHLQESVTLVSGQWVTQDNSYDALGRRYGTIQTTGGGTTPISYMYDGLNVVLAYNGSSSIASLLGLDLDELYLENIGGVQSSVLKDALGSVMGLTNSSQNLTDTYSYEPYGASTHTGTSVNGQLFAGQTYDFNNLYYMRHRYYLPAIGRFISRDPIGLAGGLNLYAYANDDPVDFSDPTGLCSNATYDGGSEAGEVAGAASASAGGWGDAASYALQGDAADINAGGVAIGIGRGIGGVGGPPAFQRGLLPDQAGGGAGGDIVESYHGQNGGGLWLAQAAAPAARPNAAPTGTPPSGAPSTFNVRTFVGCMAIMAAANPAPFVGCGAGLLGCSRGNLEGCKQILGTCPEAGGMTVVCGAAASSALK